MKTTKKCSAWAQALLKYQFLTKEAEVNEAAEVLESARKKHSDEDILSVLKELKRLPYIPRNPIGILASRMSKLPMKEFPDADEKQLAEEIAEDEANLKWVCDHAKMMAEIDGEEFTDVDWLYPDDPRMKTLRTDCVRGVTWKSVYDEAKDNGTSIKQLCRERRIDFDKLIFFIGGGYK